MVHRCLGLALALLGCAPPPRGQVVLYLQTDLPVPRLVDALRIEVLDGGGRLREQRNEIAADPQDWPISFGVAATAGRTRLRIRLYPSTRVAPGHPSGDGGAGGGAPLPGTAVDRLVEVVAPAVGVERWALLLGGECLGIPGDPATGIGCVPGLGPTAPAEAGLVPLEAPLQAADSLVGSWAELRETPCAGQPRPPSPLHNDEVCIPGGVFLLGDERIAGATTEYCLSDCAPAPERPVRISPFYLDRYEVTVGRWRAALAAGFRPRSGSWVVDGHAVSGAATWKSGPGDEELPMNGLQVQAAAAFCAWDGGRRLVTEAEWEYAASGRGEERIYPWGRERPDCHRVAFGRAPVEPVPGTPGECRAVSQSSLPDPVTDNDLDVSRDGVRGLAGNVAEWTADEAAAYDAPCWRAPVLRDPQCRSGAQADNHTVRGGMWISAPQLLNVALRRRFPTFRGGFDFSLGFRCARRAAP